MKKIGEDFGKMKKAIQKLVALKNKAFLAPIALVKFIIKKLSFIKILSVIIIAMFLR